MKILIAEDDLTSRTMLELFLQNLGYDVVSVTNGHEAWEILKGPDSPPIAILDWMMPELDGVEVCRRIREMHSHTPPYTILLTIRDQQQDIITGLDAGADDYIIKPFDKDELLARIRVGERIYLLQQSLSHRVNELQDAVSHIKTLQGVLPICSHCHKIRDDQEVWQRLELYIQDHSTAKLSHALCPECLERHYPDAILPDEDP